MIKHLYVFDDDLWQSLNKKVVEKSANQLREAGLWRLPYDDGPIWLRTDGQIFRKWFYNSDEPFSVYRCAEVRVDSLSIPPDDHSLFVKPLRFSEREKERKWIREALANPRSSYTPAERAVHEENLRQHINKEGIVKAWTSSNPFVSQTLYDDAPPVYEGPIRGLDEAALAAAMSMMEARSEWVSRVSNAEGERIKAFLADILVIVLACRGTKQRIDGRGTMAVAGQPIQGDREIVTRISLDVGPRVDLGGTHNSPIAHMRGGHLHRFRCGPGREKVIQKWVPPIFVNANAEFKSTRLRYEVKATKEPRALELAEGAE